MTTARSKQICLEQTPWYHVTTRCVRRAFICGFDEASQRDFSHRKQWIEDRLLFLSQIFCIDIAAYAVMSNHYHIVLKINRDEALSLDDAAVTARWSKLYPGNPLIKRINSEAPLSDEDIENLSRTIPIWREELANISRFMALINQFIARKSNTEDGCKGRFWEHRYSSQAILDDDALLRTLAYVDLNPVRARIAKTPETSEHTSIFWRLHTAPEHESKHTTLGLIPFRKHSPDSDEPRSHVAAELPISFAEYLALLDWTGRQLRHDKRGHIEDDIPPIFDRMGYSPKQWVKSHQPSINWQQRALGSVQRIEKYCAELKRRWIWQADDHKIC